MFRSGEDVVRERRMGQPNPYNPDEIVFRTWGHPLDILSLHSVFIASSSSAMIPDENRSQVHTAKSLYATDPSIDVQVGDRIRRGTEPPYYVISRPEVDTNPFTGWCPVVEIPLSMIEG